MVKPSTQALQAVAFLSVVLLSGCASRSSEDLGEVLGEGVKGQSLSSVYTLYQEGRLPSSPPSMDVPGQASWKGFERAEEEHMTLWMAPLAEGTHVWGEESVDVIIKPSLWKPKP